MSKSWKKGYNYCDALNARGRPCGNHVPKGFRLCPVHRREAERARTSSEHQEDKQRLKAANAEDAKDGDSA